uniref:Uncharacterized protein n=1 Tax=Anguilla anguilla TaxID=7936 RepID=A0A0E9QVB3_ANGAN
MNDFQTKENLKGQFAQK